MEYATKKDEDAIEYTILHKFNRLNWIRYLEKNPKTYHDKDVFKLIRFIYQNKEIVDIPVTKKQYFRWRAVKPKMLK